MANVQTLKLDLNVTITCSSSTYIVFIDESNEDKPMSYRQVDTRDIPSDIPEETDYFYFTTRVQFYINGEMVYTCDINNSSATYVGKKFPYEAVRDLFGFTQDSDTGFFIVTESGVIHPISYSDRMGTNYILR